MNECLIDQLNEWIMSFIDWIYQWMIEMNKEWIHKWMNEQVNEWTSESKIDY